jgi:HAD superfamily hydrolase (TIGR01549 family)
MGSKRRGVIFDLDQTLVDSSTLDALRKARRWPDVYGRIRELATYDGIAAIMTRLQASDIATAIVTSSPRPYCSKVLSSCELQVDVCICYHDTKLRKPHPAPMLLALEKLDVLPENAVAIGDSGDDIRSAKAAGVFAIAAGWGSGDVDSLKAAAPDAFVTSVNELDSFLVRHFRLDVISG